MCPFKLAPGGDSPTETIYECSRRGPLVQGVQEEGGQAAVVGRQGHGGQGASLYHLPTYLSTQSL